MRMLHNVMITFALLAMTQICQAAGNEDYELLSQVVRNKIDNASIRELMKMASADFTWGTADKKRGRSYARDVLYTVLIEIS